jgi:hypothetical protein
VKEVTAEQLASLWYGPLPLAEVARQLGWSETRVRYEAVMAHQLGPRTQDPGWSTTFDCMEVPDRRRELLR